MLFGQRLGRVRVLAETPISNGHMSNMVVAKLTTRMIVGEDTPWSVCGHKHVTALLGRFPSCGMLNEETPRPPVPLKFGS
jgi:hypothetical protein